MVIYSCIAGAAGMVLLVVSMIKRFLKMKRILRCLGAILVSLPFVLMALVANSAM